MASTSSTLIELASKSIAAATKTDAPKTVNPEISDAYRRTIQNSRYIYPDRNFGYAHEEEGTVDYATWNLLVDFALIQWAVEKELQEDSLGRMVLQMLREELATFKTHMNMETTQDVNDYLTIYDPQSAFQELEEQVSLLRSRVSNPWPSTLHVPTIYMKNIHVKLTLNGSTPVTNRLLAESSTNALGSHEQPLRCRICTPRTTVPLISQLLFGPRIQCADASAYYLPYFV